LSSFLIFKSKSIAKSVWFHDILRAERFSVGIAVFQPDAAVKGHFFNGRTTEFIHILKGAMSVTIDGIAEDLSADDSAYFSGPYPSRWRNEGGDVTELLVVW